MRTQYFELAKAQWQAGRYSWLPRLGLKYLRSYLSNWLNKPLTGPILGTVVVTYRCNHRCFMCDSVQRCQAATQQGQAEMGTTAMLAVLDDLAALGTTGVGFTGGEPLLRADIFTLLQYAKQLGLITHLNTNGSLLTPERIELVLNSGIDSINISIDGATAATHDAARQTPGSFQRIIEHVNILMAQRTARRARIRVNIVTVLSKNNLHELDTLVQLPHTLQVDGIGFLPIHEFTPAARQQSAVCRQEGQHMARVDQAVARLLTLKQQGWPIENSARYLRLFPRCFRGETLPFTCFAGYNSLVVDCYGDVFPCVPWNNWPRPVHNLRHASLRTFWASPAYQQVRDTQITPCRACFWNCHTELNLLFHPLYRTLPERFTSNQYAEK